MGGGEEGHGHNCLGKHREGGCSTSSGRWGRGKGKSPTMKRQQSSSIRSKMHFPS